MNFFMRGSGISVVAPVNTVAPVISGTARVGQTLSTTNGTFTGTAPLVYTYQWKRDGVSIGGATIGTYLLVVADAGKTITCAVTATNAAGSASATSNGLAIENVPVNSILPVITGTAIVGSILTASNGTWSNNPTSYTYQWKRNGANIGAATNSTYLLVLADQGTDITVTVTATNSAGSTAATSVATSILTVTVVLSSVHSNVDGVFIISAVFDRAVTGFTNGDVTGLNGSCESILSYDNITHYLWINPNGAGDVDVTIAAGVCTAVNNGASNSASNTVTTTIDAGWKFLVDPTKTHFGYDFRELVGNSTNNIEATDPAKNDLSGNGRNLTAINTPRVGQIAATAGYPGLRVEGQRALSTGINGTGIFNASHVFVLSVRMQDGQAASVQYLFGGKDGTNTGAIVEVSTAGILTYRLGGAVWSSSAAAFINGDNPEAVLIFTVDLGADTITVTKNGVSVAGSIVSGTLVNLEGLYANTASLYVGDSNNNGTAETNPTTNVPIIRYCYCTVAQGASASAITSYLANKKPIVELVIQEQDNTNYDAPHAIAKLTRIDPLSDVSCKGDPALTTQDGCWLKINDHANLADITIVASRVHQGDQIDGETVVILSATRSIHFVASSALLINRSDGSVVASLSYTSSVINGAERNPAGTNGDYIIGAAKDGRVLVFTTNDSWASNISLVGTKNTAADGLGAAHSFSMIDTQYALVCNNVAALGNKYAGTYRVFDGNGDLITPSGWTLASFIADDLLAGANRNKKVTSAIHALTMNSPGFGIAKINTTDPTAISLTNVIGMIDSCAGLDVYRDKYAIVGNTSRFRIVDMTSSSNCALVGGYANGVTLATTDSNIHDPVWSLNLNDMKPYATAPCQADNRIALFRINRF
jgi:hypothetical protein